jgi:rsbT co-antagonist protein RsbR
VTVGWLLGLGLASTVTLLVHLLPTLEPVAGCVRADVWPAGLIAFFVVSNLAVALAYAAIPVSLLYLLRRRRDIPVDWVLVAFALFIGLCGATHVLKVVTVWRPLYWLSTEVDAATGVVSLAVATLLPVRVIPALLRVPSPTLLREALERAEVAAAGAEEALAREAAKADELARAMVDREAALGREAQATVELRGQLDVVERQHRVIAGLNVPVIKAEAGILLLPLVGVLDSERAAQATEALLYEASHGPAVHAVLDMTGIEAVDTATAAHLLRMVAAARLVGLHVVFSGIQPAVARTMVDLGIDLERAKTFKTLGDGLAWARRALAATERS